MRLNLFIILLYSTMAIVGCSKTTTQPSSGLPQSASGTASPTATTSPVSQSVPANSTAAKPKVDACSLLSSKEIESVQGEAIKETKLSGQATGGFNMSQCFFTLPTFTNSVSLLVAQRGDGAGANNPKEFWRDTFHKDRLGERERERDKKRGGEEGEEEGSPPQKVTGIGDEAYWTGSRVGGALYVLKENSYVRISVGGPADQTTKIKKTKALAEKAIARL